MTLLNSQNVVMTPQYVISYRTIIIFCISLIIVEATPIVRDVTQPERILFALEGPRSLRNFHGQGHRRPLVSSSSSEVIRAIVGQDVVLECEAASRSGPSIHWLHHGKRISQGVAKFSEDYEEDYVDEVSVSYTGSTRSRLFINCVEPENAGEYVCVADTPTSRNITVRTLVVDEIPLENKGRRIASLRLARREWKGRSSSCERKPSDTDGARIYLWSTRRLVLEDSYVRLVCRASGIPQPKIIWLDRNEKPITNADAQYQLMDNGDLVIHKATFKQNMGVYQCIADNGHGVDTVSAFVYPAGKDMNGPTAKHI